MRINGFEGVSLLDYPGKICSIVYTSPCNFKCPFCHNPSLVTANFEVLSGDDILADIFDRREFIDAVTVTGGEPVLQPDLPEFFSKIHAMGLLTKLDTNGYEPEILKKLVEGGLLDYIAMDIKTSPDMYPKAAGMKMDPKRIKKALNYIMNCGIDYCFRTTAVPGLVTEEDFKAIAHTIEGAPYYVIQQFDNEMPLEPSYKKIKPYTEKQLEVFADIMRKHVKAVKVVNIKVPAGIS
jgi:pyruvate formate lyase activating enzyme